MTRKTTTPVEEIAAETEEITFSAKELAAELLLDPKDFRRWLRAHTEERANKGGRWIFSPDARDEILAAYAADKAPKEADLED